MPAPIGAYLVAFGAMAFSACWALLLYRTVSHLDPPAIARNEDAHAAAPLATVA